MRAWHFLSADGTARGVEPPPDGEWWEHTGGIELCRTGLHASVSALDALSYAPGPIVCRVECGGEIVHEADKLVCRRRKILWRYDATEVLRHFARLCALDVVRLWDPPTIVLRYLRTGDETTRDAARAAAREAAGGAQSRRLARMLREGRR